MTGKRNSYDLLIILSNLYKEPMETNKKLGVHPQECVVVEDAVNGVQAAHTARMRCIAVTTTFPADELHEADVVRDKISDVQCLTWRLPNNLQSQVAKFPS